MTLHINRIDLSYPLPLFESRNSLPANRVAPCSVLFNNQEIAGLFLACSSKDMKYFKIRASSPPQPPLNFRMLNFDKQIFVIEIWMQFSKNPEKYLKVHLNPHDRQVKRLLKLGVETNMISFHFYDTESKLLATAITGLDDSENTWFHRNYQLSRKLKPDTIGYEILAEHLTKQISDTDRIFDYLAIKNSDFFVREGGTQVMFLDMSGQN